MFGRSKLCLLAISIFLFAPIFLIGQTEHSPSGGRVGTDFEPRLPEAVESDWAPVRLPPRVPVAPPGFGFPQFSRVAGVIFSGTVAKIEPRRATRGQPLETVAVTFHVESSIRGATPGKDIVIAEWIGLWLGGQQYRIGERVLLFLYPPSKLGLTSSIGGPMGRFAVDPYGRVLLTAQQLAAFQKDPVLGGKSRVRMSDFALAVRRAGEEE